MSYEYDEPQSKLGIFFIIGVLIISIISGALLFTDCSGTTHTSTSTNPNTDTSVPSEDTTTPPHTSSNTNQIPDTSTPTETPDQALNTTQNEAENINPEILLQQISEALEKGNLEKATALIGKDALDEKNLARLKEMMAASALKFHKTNPIIEIGELEANRKARWALKLENEYASRIYFDLTRLPNKKWAIEKITLPPYIRTGQQVPRAVLVDALGIADAFLQSALEQNFEDAKSFVNSSHVSDATIAGLCIIFEDAKYKLRDHKPLRSMFNRPTTAGFMANVVNPNGEKAAEFGLLVQRTDENSPWQIQEINLEQLLADYATRIAGGDVHFTPLIKNPEGGDTLILYFGFDEDTLTPRTARQLDIVSMLMRTDPEKKLTLSGHTDALGSDNYNTGLSAQRATTVKDYLIHAGVPEKQIITIAAGEAKPRQPNETETGDDNPAGRRANRRTEIYLDF